MNSIKNAAKIMDFETFKKEALKTGIPFSSFTDNGMESMFTILKADHDFPVFVAQNSCGLYEVVPSNHLFGEKLDNQEALVDFAVKYVYGYVPFEQFRNWAVSEAFKMNREAGDDREYTQSDYESASWAVAGIYERSGVAGCINYLLNYKYTPRKKIARGYC